MNQLSLLDWQPPPELMEEPQPKVLADCEDLLQLKPPVSPHALAWQEGSIAYYRKLMMRFMELQRLNAIAGTATPQKQAMRQHMISVLQAQCVVCLAKIQQLQGGTDANT